MQPLGGMHRARCRRSPTGVDSTQSLPEDLAASERRGPWVFGLGARAAGVAPYGADRASEGERRQGGYGSGDLRFCR